MGKKRYYNHSKELFDRKHDDRFLGFLDVTYDELKKKNPLEIQNLFNQKLKEVQTSDDFLELEMSIWYLNWLLGMDTEFLTKVNNIRCDAFDKETDEKVNYLRYDVYGSTSVNKVATMHRYLKIQVQGASLVNKPKPEDINKGRRYIVAGIFRKHFDFDIENIVIEYLRGMSPGKFIDIKDDFTKISVDELSTEFLKYSEAKRINSLVHSIFHVIIKDMKHNSKWHKLANQFNNTSELVDKYGKIEQFYNYGTNIDIDYNYWVMCEGCHDSMYSNTMKTNFVKHPEFYYCSRCGSSLIPLKNKHLMKKRMYDNDKKYEMFDYLDVKLEEYDDLTLDDKRKILEDKFLSIKSIAEIKEFLKYRNIYLTKYFNYNGLVFKNGNNNKITDYQLGEYIQKISNRKDDMSNLIFFKSAKGDFKEIDIKNLHNEVELNTLYMNNPHQNTVEVL